MRIDDTDDSDAGYVINNGGLHCNVRWDTTSLAHHSPQLIEAQFSHHST